MQRPYGPRSISQNRQIAVPVELMRAASLEPGDEVYFELGDDGVLRVIPVEIAARWWEAGKRSADKEDPATRLDPHEAQGDNGDA